MRQNLVKQQLQAGKASIGTWLSLGSALGAEWMAHQGFDWLGVEQEHSPNDLTLTASLPRAISTTDVIPLVRVPWSEPQTIGRALDAGALGLFFPMIETREDAELCVTVRAPAPAGGRGLRGASGPPSAEACDRDYPSQDLLVVVTIETALGLRNIDAITSVPDIDACFVRPNELCAAIGLEPNPEPTDPRFFEALGHIYDACRRNGVAPGLDVPTPQQAIRHIDEGWQLIAVASDGEMMTRAAAIAAATIREHVARRSAQKPPDRRVDACQALDSRV